MPKFSIKTWVAYYVLVALAIVAPFSWASIIGSLPYTLTNGATADATQVMANYQKIIDDCNANCAAAGANSDITALLGLTTPLSPTQGGTNQFYCGSSGGSANAQTCASMTPNNYVLTSGYSITFTAGFSNTAAMTFSGNGTTAKNVFKRTPAGAIALTGGEVISGNKYTISYDGTQYQLNTPTDGAFGVRTDLASAGTTDLGTVGAHNVNITGTTGITAFGSSAVTAYPLYKLRFNASLTITYNASSLILPGATNITTQAGDTAWANYLGSGNWQVVDYTRSGVFPSTGQLARVNYYTSNATWTKGTDERSVFFRCAGGGGAGGGAGNTGAAQGSAGVGGGSGGYAERYLAAPAASYSITIPAAAAGVSDGTGNNGGNVTVGAVLTCNGGTGGPRIAITGTTTVLEGGAGGTAGSGDLNVTGTGGGPALVTGDAGGAYYPLGGAGGSNPMGNGGAGGIATSGDGAVNAGQGCGGGGGGTAAALGAGTAHAGGAGAAGCVIAYTYY